MEMRDRVFRWARRQDERVKWKATIPLHIFMRVLRACGQGVKKVLRLFKAGRRPIS